MATAPRRTTATRRTGTLDETTVVAMAVEVLEAEGIDRLSLAAVAQRLGVTQPALYRHVGGYDELLRALALVGRERLLADLTDAAVGRSGPEALRAVAAAWRAFVREHPALYAATDRSPLAGDERNEAASRAIVHLLTRVIDGFGLDAVEAERAAWAVRSALHGFADLERQSGHPASVPLDDTFDRLVALVAAGLAHWDDLGTT